jgi:hypothetical protein
MIHDLTIGHLDATAVIDRMVVVLRPLDIPLVHRLLAELGSTDEQGNPTLGGWKVLLCDGYVIAPWKGGWTN